MRTARELISNINNELKRPLSPNEVELLHSVFVSGLLNHRTVKRELFPKMAKGNSHRLTRRLTEKRFLDALRIEDGSILGWRLNERILKTFTQHIGFQGSGTYRYSPFTEPHNQVVRNISRFLDRVLNVQWIVHEPSIRAHQMAVNPMARGHLDISVPDLLISMLANDSEIKIAFEIELTKKCSSRLDQILENRIASDQWDRVVYLLGRSLSIDTYLDRVRQTMNTSAKIMMNHRCNPILFVPLEEFQKCGINAKGFMAKGETSFQLFIKSADNPSDNGCQIGYQQNTFG